MTAHKEERDVGVGEHIPETISNCLISQKPRPPPPQLHTPVRVFSVTAGNGKGSARKHDPEPCMTCDLHVPGTTPPPRTHNPHDLPWEVQYRHYGYNVRLYDIYRHVLF